MSLKDRLDNMSRRTYVAGGLGAIGAATAGALTLNEARKYFLTPSYAEGNSDDAHDRIDDIEEGEFYESISQEDFISIYGHVRDELDEGDYGLRKGTLHEEILSESAFETYTDGEGDELEDFSIAYRPNGSVDSKREVGIDRPRRDTIYRERDVKDPAAQAFVDAMWAELDNDAIERYEVDLDE